MHWIKITKSIKKPTVTLISELHMQSPVILTKLWSINHSILVIQVESIMILNLLFFIAVLHQVTSQACYETCMTVRKFLSANVLLENWQRIFHN